MENVGDNFPSWVFTFGVKLTKYWRSSLTPVGIIQKFEKCQTNAFSHTHVDLLWNFWFPLKIVWRLVIKTNVELFEFLLCGQKARNKNTCLAYWTEREGWEMCLVQGREGHCGEKTCVKGVVLFCVLLCSVLFWERTCVEGGRMVPVDARDTFFQCHQTWD